MPQEGFDGLRTALASLLAELVTKTEPGDTQTVAISPATAAVLSSVASSATSVTLLAANAGRRLAMIFNDSSQPLNVKYGAAATASSYTVRILAGGYFEFPLPIYVGIVDGIWDSANGAARITEIT